jgi:hypothetical protein
MNKQAVFAAAAACLLSVAITQNSTEPENHGIVVAYMDRSVKPGEDFYHYANGEWIKKAQLPLDSGCIAVGGWTEDQSSDLTRKRSAELIQEAIKANAPAGSNVRKIADLYRSLTLWLRFRLRSCTLPRDRIWRGLQPSATGTTWHELWVKASAWMSIP